MYVPLRSNYNQSDIVGTPIPHYKEGGKEVISFRKFSRKGGEGSEFSHKKEEFSKIGSCSKKEGFTN